MRKTNQNEAAKLLRLGLQFFAEGDGGAGSGAAASGAAGQPATGGQPSNAPTASGNDTGNGSGTGQPAGKTYTDEDAAAVAKQFGLMNYETAKGRFKGALDKAHKHDDMSLRLGALAKRYGLEAGAKAEDVLAAIESDSGYIEKKARELGTDNETAKRYVSMEEQLARIEREKLDESDRQAMKKLSEQIAALDEQVKDVQAELRDLLLGKEYRVGHIHRANISILILGQAAEHILRTIEA